MVIANDEDFKVDTCSVITYFCQRRGRQRSHKYLPDEIWLEILSRLPIKSLFISQSVCKLWRNFFFTLKNKINTDPLYVPLCGLLLLSFGPIEDLNKMDYFSSYFCLRAKENFIIRYDSPESKLVCSSGFERGLLSEQYFDFSVTQKIAPLVQDGFLTIISNGGLLLATLDDGTFQVHNPATKQIYFVPKSPIVQKYGFNRHARVEVCGLIIQLPSFLTKQRCRFIVVRFCIIMKIMEVYYPWTRVWRKYRLKLDDELVSSTIGWCLRNYVGFFESGVLSLYVLNNKDCGVAIKFKGPMNSKMKQYRFPLPEVVLGGIGNVRIWECEKSLYLTYYNNVGLWIWKAGSTEVDSWAWVPVLEISRVRQLCKPVAREHLYKAVLNASVRVQPVACHPNVAVVYLLIKSSVFTYNLNTDTLDRIGEIKDYEYRRLNFAYTFKPCFNFMYPSNGGQ